MLLYRNGHTVGRNCKATCSFQSTQATPCKPGCQSSSVRVCQEPGMQDMRQRCGSLQHYGVVFKKKCCTYSKQLHMRHVVWPPSMLRQACSCRLHARRTLQLSPCIIDGRSYHITAKQTVQTDSTRPYHSVRRPYRHTCMLFLSWPTLRQRVKAHVSWLQLPVGVVEILTLPPAALQQVLSTGAAVLLTQQGQSIALISADSVSGHCTCCTARRCCSCDLNKDFLLV